MLQDGQIDAEELQRCLSSGFPQKGECTMCVRVSVCTTSNSPCMCALLSGFTKETCRIMIAMLDVSLLLHTWGRGDVVVDGGVYGRGF